VSAEGAETGCTDCGRKGGCDHRKGEMFAAIDQALARLYPTRRWGERDEAVALGAGVPGPKITDLADRLAARLKTLVVSLPGQLDEPCDFVYVLCFGREPSILQVREGLLPPDQAWDEAGGGAPLEELHLRVALSSFAPFAAVQQVTLRMERLGDDLVIAEAPRTGVFDPILLPRYQQLAAVLAELDIRNLDFGDLTNAPPGFDASDYGERFGGEPVVANYLFYPQPCSSITTCVMRISKGSDAGSTDP
jgi:hypothetical protein